MKKLYPIFIILVLFNQNLFSQKIFYSTPEGVEPNRIKYEVIAKKDNTIIIYKSILNNTYAATNSIYFYDPEMNLAKQVDLSLPKDVYAVSFLTYEDFFYMFYQYQKGYTVYCMAVKLNYNGDQRGEPVILEQVNKMDYYQKNQVFTVIYSDNKKRIAVLKQNHQKDEDVILSLKIFDVDLSTVSAGEYDIAVNKKKEFLTDFAIDNDGNIVCIRISESDKYAQLAKTSLIVKTIQADSVVFVNMLTPDIYINEPLLKIDNLNKRYIIASLYSNDRGGNIKGLYCFTWDLLSGESKNIAKVEFNKTLRDQVKFHNASSKAFNNTYLSNIQVKNDGSFIIDAGSFEMFPDRSLYDRWNYQQYFAYTLPSGYDVYDPYDYNLVYPWKVWNGSVTEKNTFTGSNIVVFSFDSAVNANWIKTIPFYQYNPLYFYTVGYKTLTESDNIYFLGNRYAKNKSFISLQKINNEGNIQTDILLRDIDVAIANDYTFLPRYAKQITKTEVIVPCYKGHHVCFARIIFTE